MVAKPNVKAFFVGLNTIDAMEGMLAKIEDKAHKRRSVCLEKWVYHLKRISEMHQKLGTLS